MQELKDRHAVTHDNGWTVTVTRDDKNGITRGYIVTAQNEAMSTTIATVSVKPWGTAVAFAIALNYSRLLIATMSDTGPALNFHPRPNRYYIEPTN